jgi:anti-sigma B factor antagonist
LTLVSDRPAQVGRSPVVRFEVDVRPDRDVVYVAPTGELDMATAPRMRRQVDELVAAGFTELVIDLRGIDFIDCSGLQLLLALDADARGDGWNLTIVEGHDAIQRLFTLTDTADTLPFTSADGLRPRPRSTDPRG